jgi:hypothetical protein
MKQVYGMGEQGVCLSTRLHEGVRVELFSRLAFGKEHTYCIIRSG